MPRHALPMHDLASSPVRHTPGRHRTPDARTAKPKSRTRVAAIAALAVVLPTSIAAASSAGATTSLSAVAGPIATDATTGVPAGTRLTAQAAGRITRAGAVIDGADIAGTVTIAAPNVTIRNSRIHGSASTPYGIHVESGSVTVVDSEIKGFSYGIGGSNWTAIRVDISGTAQDAVKLGSDVSLVDSWVHALGVAGGGSVDGAQLDSAAHDILLRGNTIDVTGAHPANSAVFVKPSGITLAGGPLTIDDNWLDGGTATLQVLKSSTGGAEAGVMVTGNYFGRHGRSPARISAPATVSGNVWADTGAALTLPGGTNAVAATAPASPTSTPSQRPTSSPSPSPTSSLTPTTAPSSTPTTTPSPTPTQTSTPTTSPTSPAATSPTTQAVAPSATKPGPGNTGVPAGVALTASGSITVTTPNTVIDSKAVNGTITVSASGVVIKNTRVTGTGAYGVYVTSGDVTIEDTEISGFQNAIYGDNWTGLRLNIHGTTQDGVKLGSYVLLQDSWIHDLTPEPGAHADGGQVQSGVVDTVVRHNVIDSSNTSTGTFGNSALIVKPDFGPTSSGPVVIENNWLNGGNYTLYVVPGSSGSTITEVDVRNNRFGDTHQYGYADITFPVNAAGNVIDSTGAPLTLG